MTTYFDLDGTLNKFYEVPNWLPKLLACDASPYADAAVALNMSLLARYLNKVQAQGNKIGIISWTSKTCPPDYAKRIEEAKLEWLERHLPSVHWDIIHIVAYGTPKQSFATDEDILFDDEEPNRQAWTGQAFAPDEIFQVLKGLCE